MNQKTHLDDQAHQTPHVVNSPVAPATVAPATADLSASRVAPTTTSPAATAPAATAPAATSPTREHLTDLDLQELNRMLNSPDSNLPPQYKEYLRTQLSAIVGEDATRVTADRLHPKRQFSEAIARDPNIEQVSYETASKSPVTPESSEPIFDKALVPPREKLPLGLPPKVEPDDETVAAALPKKDIPSKSQPAKLADPTNPKPELRRGEWKEHLTKALDTLEQELARYTPSEREGMQMAISARLLHLIANHRDKAVAAMDQLDEDEREFWKHQLHALMIAIDAEDKHAASRRAALTLRELREAADYLSNQSTLDVRNLAFCERVDSFGVYTPVKSVAFKPGQPVLLYVEIDNFAVHQSGDKYETRFHAEYNLIGPSGYRFNKKFNPVEELDGRNRRHDFFVSYYVEIPTDLAPGQYRLQLVVEDVIGQKSSEAFIDFRIR